MGEATAGTWDAHITRHAASLCADFIQSGLCTCTITVSQAHVAAEASAVSNTVAARVIIISIMTIDWISGGSGLPYQGSLGLSIAIIGIVA